MPAHFSEAAGAVALFIMEVGMAADGIVVVDSHMVKETEAEAGTIEERSITR